MRWSPSDLVEVIGLVLVAVAVGFLAGAWWGVLVGGAALVVYGIALDHAADSPTDDG